MRRYIKHSRHYLTTLLNISRFVEILCYSSYFELSSRPLKCGEAQSFVFDILLKLLPRRLTNSDATAIFSFVNPSLQQKTTSTRCFWCNCLQLKSAISLIKRSRGTLKWYERTYHSHRNTSVRYMKPNNSDAKLQIQICHTRKNAAIKFRSHSNIVVPCYWL